METKIELENAKIKILGKEIDVPMRVETTTHGDGRQDVNIHLPSLSTIVGEADGKRNL